MLTMTINVETNSHKIVFLSYFSLLFLYLLLFIIIVSSFIPRKCPYFMLALYLLPLDLFQQMPSNPQKELKKKIKINLNDLSTYYLFILSCSTFLYLFSSSVRIATKEKIIFYFYIFLCGVTFAMETSLTN